MKNKPIKIITYGTYDMLHIGHINILTRAKEQGDYLIVGVTSEDYDRSRGKLNVAQSQEDRLNAIKQLHFVDEVILETHKTQKQEDMVKYNIDKFVIGDDWVGKFDYLNKYTNVVYLPRTKGISSTQLRLENIKNISLGVIGIRYDIGRFLSESKFVSNVTIDGICRYDEVLDKNIQQKHNIKYIYDDFDDMLNSSVDAVYIASNIKDHYAHVKKALLKNKHILCENPLVIEEHKAKELFDIAKKRKKLLLLALKTAFLPAFNKLQDELKSGVIGDIKEIRATFTSLYEEKNYPNSYIQNGATNLLMNYPSLIMLKIAGESKSITFFDQREKGYDISNRAITTHKNNIIGISTVGIGIKSNSSATISGTKGFVYIPAPWWLTREFYFKFEDVSKEYHFEYEFEGDGLRYMISEFATIIQRDEIKSIRLTQDDMLELNKIIIKYNKANITT